MLTIKQIFFTAFTKYEAVNKLLKCSIILSFFLSRNFLYLREVFNLGEGYVKHCSEWYTKNFILFRLSMKDRIL